MTISRSPGVLRAADTWRDGYGIHAYLPDHGHSVTTSGHNYPYVSGWASGDLTEGHQYTREVCLTKGGVDSPCISDTVTA